MNKNERLSIDLKINLDILEELYYSNITKRGLYKVICQHFIGQTIYNLTNHFQT